MAVAFSCNCLASRTVDSHLSAQDLQRFQSVFITALSSNDLQSIYYASLNIEPTNAEEKKQLCGKLSKLHEESKLNVSPVSKDPINHEC